MVCFIIFAVCRETSHSEQGYYILHKLWWCFLLCYRSREIVCVKSVYWEGSWVKCFTQKSRQD